MTTVEEHRTTVDQAEQVEPDGPAPAGGDPTMIGLPTFVLGSIALGLALTGYLPATAAAGALPVIMLATGLGTGIAMIWSIRLGASVLACVFGLFSACWLSYATLVLGLTHGWFAIAPEDATRTLSSVPADLDPRRRRAHRRHPAAAAGLHGAVRAGRRRARPGAAGQRTDLTEPDQAGGYVPFLFAGLGIYLFADSAAAATGAKPFPVGQPLSG